VKEVIKYDRDCARFLAILLKKGIGCKFVPPVQSGEGVGTSAREGSIATEAELVLE